MAGKGEIQSRPTRFEGNQHDHATPLAAAAALATAATALAAVVVAKSPVIVAVFSLLAPGASSPPAGCILLPIVLFILFFPLERSHCLQTILGAGLTREVGHGEPPCTKRRGEHVKEGGVGGENEVFPELP